MLFCKAITTLLPFLTWVDTSSTFTCYGFRLWLTGTERITYSTSQWSKPALFWQSGSERSWSGSYKLYSGLRPKQSCRTFFTLKLSLSSSFGEPCTYPSITQKLNVGGWRITWSQVRSSEVSCCSFFSWNLGFLERSSWFWGVLKTACKLYVNGRLLFLSLLCLFFLLGKDPV